MDPRERMNQGLAQATDQQPWRCVKCDVPVSPIKNNHCLCTRFPVGTTVIDPLNRSVKVVDHVPGFVVIKLAGPYGAQIRYPASCLSVPA